MLWQWVSGTLGGERHWCDDFIYEAVLCPLVDILDSKRVYIEMIDGFVRSVDSQVIASSILDLDSNGWTSVLDCYFNPVHYVTEPPDESSDSNDEEATEAWAESERKKNIIFEAWEVFRVGVINHDLGPFRRLVYSEENWLSVVAAIQVVDIGERASVILHYLE
ncbi:hypothetical protein SUGI_0918550 [Cryptomeria japonica]|nr:hypothetical protein SUGI_0918550 [Cryptomeria japonica]